jgi:1-deoxy-D-xylulose-5-phosphate reductoisomerase
MYFCIHISCFGLNLIILCQYFKKIGFIFMSSMEKKGIAILGSTGSIGTQALEVIAAHSDTFELVAIAAGKNAELLIQQALQYNPNTVVIADESQYQKVKDALWQTDVKVFAGEDALLQIVAMSQIDVVLTAMVGFAGLKPTLAAIENGKHIALANKETLVVAGDLVTQKAREKGVNIYPVDSEHSAIFQCLAGEWHNKIEKIYLTASGGPFRGKKKSELDNILPQHALKHPNWSMGAKITIDSATLMNKGLEVIEAKWLFGLNPAQIDVVVHPESIVHSLVQFEDGSIKAQMGLPDMKLPILYALAYPKRLKTDFPRFDFKDYARLHFESPDVDTFSCLKLAFDAMQKGGNTACALNAANEIAVASFLANKIAFLDIARLNETVMHEVAHIEKPSLSDYLHSDKHARALAQSWVAKNTKA